MKNTLLLLGICLLLGLFTGCNQKTAPIEEGTIWSVVWSESPNTQTGLFRAKAIPANGPAGQYGVDMYGKLYPDCLEIQQAGNSHVQVIPMREIIALEFGD